MRTRKHVETFPAVPAELRSAFRGAALGMENDEEFQRITASYTAEFEPRSRAEEELIHELAWNRWRMLRCWKLETSLFDGEIARNGSPAEAFEALAGDSRTLLALGDYEDRCRQAWHRALRTLLDLRAHPGPGPRLVAMRRAAPKRESKARQPGQLRIVGRAA